MLTQTSRKTAFALTVVAAVSTPASLTSSLANAADANGFPACAKLTGTAKALCAVKELDKRIAAEKKKEAAANREAAASRKRYEAAKVVEACVDYLIAGMKSGIFTKEEILEKAGGLAKLRQGDTACVVAKKHFGYGKKAEAQPHIQ